MTKRLKRPHCSGNKSASDYQRKRIAALEKEVLDMRIALQTLQVQRKALLR